MFTYTVFTELRMQDTSDTAMNKAASFLSIISVYLNEIS